MANLLLLTLKAVHATLSSFLAESLDDVDLAQLHRLQSSPVALGGNTGAAISNHIHRNLGQRSLSQNGIGHNTDSGTQTHQSNLFNTQTLIDIEQNVRQSQK